MFWEKYLIFNEKKIWARGTLSMDRYTLQSLTGNTLNAGSEWDNNINHQLSIF